MNRVAIIIPYFLNSTPPIGFGLTSLRSAD